MKQISENNIKRVIATLMGKIPTKLSDLLPDVNTYDIIWCDELPDITNADTSKIYIVKTETQTIQ